VLVKKTLKSAIANAENNAELKVDTLLVKEAVIGEGPTFKRFRARARGSASSLRKRTSHIRIVLSDELVPAVEKPRKKRPSSKTAPSEPRHPKKQTKAVTAADTDAKQTSVALDAPNLVKPAEPAAEAKSGEEKE